MTNKLPTGKGLFEWCVTDCGTPQAMADEAKAMGMGHVLWHVVDGYLNDEHVSHGAKLEPYIAAMKAVGVECWGWGAIYATNYNESVPIIDDAIKRLGLAGFVVDAEAGMANARAQARDFMKLLRVRQPTIPIGLSSYRYPSMHAELPWAEFRQNGITFDMPQVYYEKSHNPTQQLDEGYAEFQKLSPVLPYVPTMPLYQNGGWKPTLSDQVAFLNEVVKLGFTGVNAWDWFQGRRDLPDLWKAFGEFPFGDAPVEPPVIITPPVEEEIVIEFTVQTATLRVHTEPNTTSATIGTFAKGDIVVMLGKKVYGYGNSWILTRINGQEGYCAFEYLNTLYLK